MSSTSVARAIIKPAVQASEAMRPEVVNSVHVDDVGQETAGSEQEILAALKEAGTMTEQGQIMSSKSVVVSSSK